jgi:hypothetical protein
MPFQGQFPVPEKKKKKKNSMKSQVLAGPNQHGVNDDVINKGQLQWK